MRLSRYYTLTILAAIGGLSAAASADTFRYSIDLGSGQEALGFANGGNQFLQIASVATADGWQSRFAVEPGSAYFHEFNVNLYSGDSPSMFGAIHDHFANPNYNMTGNLIGVDITKGSYSSVVFKGFLNKVGFPDVQTGSTSTGPIALGITPWIEPVSIYNPLGGSPPAPAGPTSSMAGFDLGNVDLRIGGHTVNASEVHAITVTSNEYQNSIFGMTKDCSDLVFTVNESMQVALAHFSHGNCGEAKVIYHATGGGQSYRLTLKGLVFRGVAPVQMTDAAFRNRASVYFTVQSASFGPA